MRNLINKIFLMTVVAFMLMFATVSAQTYGQVLVTQGEPDSSNFAEEVLELVNIERQKVGAAPLKLSTNKQLNPVMIVFSIFIVAVAKTQIFKSTI